MTTACLAACGQCLNATLNAVENSGGSVSTMATVGVPLIIGAFTLVQMIWTAVTKMPGVQTALHLTSVNHDVALKTIHAKVDQVITLSKSEKTPPSSVSS